jgi:phospholipase C
VYYLDSKNKVNELWWKSGRGWENAPLPGQAAAGSALACFGVSGYVRVYYLDSNNYVNELALLGDDWVKNPFPVPGTPLLGGPAAQAAAGSALACFGVGGTAARVYYLDSNNHVNEFAWVVIPDLRTTPPTYKWNKYDVVDGIKPIKASPTTGAKGLGVPNLAPGEKFHEVNTQLFEELDPGARDTPTMKGYVRDFVRVLHEQKVPRDKWQRYADQVMQCYLPIQLPVLNGLAEHYAVCDMWFSSVPSQTNPNRAFALCGTSMGLVDNGFLEEDPRRTKIEELVGYNLGDDRFKTDTIFNALEGDGKTTWKIFGRSALLQNKIALVLKAVDGAGPVERLAVKEAINLKTGLDSNNLAYLVECSDPDVVSSDYTWRLFPNIQKVTDAKSHFAKIDDFYAMAREGRLPNFSYLEPDWTIAETGTGANWTMRDPKSLVKILLFHQGNDYHPPGNLDAAENLVKRVYDSVIANREAWKKTLLLITFDEPVGSFDHVPPPAAIPPWESKRVQTYQDGSMRVLDKGQPGKTNVPGTAIDHTVAGGFVLEHKFDFKRYGGRVPTILVSPLIEKGTVFRSATNVPFDHTSIIATILKWRGLKDRIPDFGIRTASAPTFENVVTLTLSTPRTDEKEVRFLKFSRSSGQVVHFYDRFYLKAKESGKYVSGFEEKEMNPLIELASTDPTFIEYFPRLASTRSAPFYFQLVKDRPSAAEITADGKTEVRLITTDDGVGAYNVLGKWKDSDYCYYFNDYLEGEHSDQETWILKKDDESKLKFGDQVTITNKAKNSQLIQSADKLTCSNQTPQYWIIEPLPG